MVLKSDGCRNSYTDRAFRTSAWRAAMLRVAPESHKADASEPVDDNSSSIDVFMPRLRAQHLVQTTLQIWRAMIVSRMGTCKESGCEGGNCDYFRDKVEIRWRIR